MLLRKGIYEHFKGGRYRFIRLARDAETLEELVVYEPLYETEFGDVFWVRPLKEFLEVIERDGKRQPRFRLVAGEGQAEQ